MGNERALEIAKQRSYTVVKSNEIIQKARYDLKVTELKLLAYIISKVKPTDTELQEYSFSVKDFCQVCGIDYTNGNNYQKIKELLKGLRDKSFWMMDENGHETLVGWLGKARINKGSGVIQVKLDDDLQKYVVGLFSNYTQYELLSTLPMKSAYSFRIYELLKSYAFTDEHTFKVEELKQQLGAEHYKNFKDFRRKVIEVAVRDINRYTDIEVSWEPVVYGRKVVEVTFLINQRGVYDRSYASRRATKAIEDQIEGQMSLFDYYR